MPVFPANSWKAGLETINIQEEGNPRGSDVADVFQSRQQVMPFVAMSDSQFLE
jgi:hypothetical protein